MCFLLGFMLVWIVPIFVAWHPVEAQSGDLNAQFFIALDGNDANPGTREKPWATVAHAQQQLRADPLKTKNVVIRGGQYHLKEPLVFTAADSGSRYQAHPNEQPVFTAGEKITGWTVKDGRWTVTLPDVASGKWQFTQLFVNGQRMPRPRLPETGYYYVQALLPPTDANKKKGYDQVQFKPGDIKADWHNLADVEVIAFHLWSASRFKPAAVDEKNSIIQFTGTTPGTDDWTRMPYNGRYLVENVREALNKPGQWYLDNQSGVLTYLPMPGQTPENTTVIAPRLTHFVEFRGSPAKSEFVGNVTLDGLAFEHANWTPGVKGQSTPQAESNLPAAIRGVGMRDCVIENCRVSHVGEYALSLGLGSKNNLVSNCEFTDLGAGGIKIGEMDYFETDALVASNNTVSNCLIAHGGRIHSAGVGVWIGHSYGNKILHNDIVDLYYTGISPGWAWGYGKSLSHHNEIAYNHIRQIGQGVLSDMGGVYTLGAGEGNHIHHNVIHDVDSYSYGGWGIYFDEGTSKLLTESNLVYNTRSAGFHQHYGRENVLRNNIFAFGGEAQLMRTRPEPQHQTLDIQHNIFISKSAPMFGMDWSGGNYVLNHNIYFRTDGKPVIFPGGLTFEKWQAKGQDKDSSIADPGFVDADNLNFNLKPDALALKMGFKPFDHSQAGRAGAKPYTGVMPRAFPVYEYPPGKEISESFEAVPVGDKAPGAKTYEDSPEGTARVTEEAAGAGKRSLKFTDSKNNKAEYNPHVYWEPHFKEGTLTSSFLLRPEPGAFIRNEWRDYTGSYISGPHIYIKADGTLMAGNDTITKLPHGVFSKFVITCTLGSGAWTLTVTPAGGEPITKTFTCSKEFKSLDWLGFTSHATQEAFFYVDDVKLAPANHFQAR